MKKVMLAVMISSVMLLSGCETETKEVSQNYDIPEGLKDCKLYEMKGKDGGRLTIVRCPLSATTTTYSAGKSTVTNTVVEQPEQNSVKSMLKDGKNSNEVEINGETYRKSESMQEIQINGETYKKIQ